MTTPLAQTYSYRARNSAGKIVKGQMEAAGESAVVSRMRSMGLSPVEIRPKTAGARLAMEINLGAFGRGVTLKDVAIMSRQLATMIDAGLSLLRALSILASQTDNKTLASALDTVRTSVEGGLALSDALDRHREIFPPLMIHMVTAGETGGFLGSALESVADTLEADVKLRATITSALTYPVVVLAMAVLSVVGMLLFIVPIFEKMFSDLGGELPLPTQILVILSRGMVWIAPVLVIGGIVFAVWWKRNKHTDAVRSKVDPFKLKLPIFGTLFGKVAIARFTRNFATMTGSGVPVLQSLAIVGDTSGNWVIEKALINVQNSVRAGRTIAEPLANEPVFPAMVSQMIAVGEDSGSLERMLSKIADFYDDDVKATTEALTSLIEPLMIAIIGVVIGGMIIALYMPIFTIFDQIH